MNRALIVIGILALIVVSVYAAKDYNIPVGTVQKAKIQRIMISVKDNRLQADLYWNLIGNQGQVLAENQQTSVAKDFTNNVKWADVKDFFKTEISDKFHADRINFANDDTE